MRARLPRWSSALVIVAVLTACGSGDGSGGSGEDEFRTELQAIVSGASEHYGELARSAAALDLAEPLSDDFKAQMRAVAISDRNAADAIEALTPPPAATEATEALVDALRARADAFDEAAGRSSVTMQQLESDGALTEAGERIDHALRQLREGGFLPDEEPHD